MSLVTFFTVWALIDSLTSMINLLGSEIDKERIRQAAEDPQTSVVGLYFLHRRLKNRGKITELDWDIFCTINRRKAEKEQIKKTVGEHPANEILTQALKRKLPMSESFFRAKENVSKYGNIVVAATSKTFDFAKKKTVFKKQSPPSDGST